MPRRRGGVGRTGRHHPALPAEGRPRAPSNSPLALLVALVESLQERLPHPLAVREHLLVATTPRLELDDLDIARRVAVGAATCLGLADLVQALLRLAVEEAHHIRNTPNVVSGIGAFSALARPSASTRRVSSGSITPSSQRRAVE